MVCAGGAPPATDRQGGPSSSSVACWRPSWLPDRPPPRPARSNTPAANPDLPIACGIDIHVILDESGSVKNYRSDVQQAFRAFTSALKNTGSSMAVSEFSTVARLPLQAPYTRAYTDVTDATIR